MHLRAQDLLLALAIGAEVFAIAALWPLAELASEARRGALFLAALAIVAGCIALDAQGLAFPVMHPDSWRWSLAHSLQWMTIPLFIAFPCAVCVASAQSLMRAGVSAKPARVTALCIGALAVVIAPAATIIAGCGLTGACS